MNSSNEEGKVTKCDKTSTIAPEQNNNVHVYHHDWAAMQAYYGPRLAIPQYYNSNMAPHGHAPPPYMWAPPSPMMTPYGSPYPAFCPPGGVYAHPGVQMGSQSQGHVSQPTPMVTTPLNMDVPAKTHGNTDHGFMKKLKEFDGLAMSISNNDKLMSVEEHSNEHTSSQSSENDGSRNASDDNTTGGEHSARKRSRERSPTTDGKTMVNHVISSTMDFHNSSGINGTTTQPSRGTSPEVWNEKELKREKRKQSNRESARRSRLRKQAETEELSVKVNALVAENMTLRSKLSQLSDNSEKLRLENEALLEQVNKAAKTEATGKTENLISQVDKNNSVSGSKQQQVLNASPRTDPVAAK